MEHKYTCDDFDIINLDRRLYIVPNKETIKPILHSINKDKNTEQETLNKDLETLNKDLETLNKKLETLTLNKKLETLDKKSINEILDEKIKLSNEKIKLLDNLDNISMMIYNILELINDDNKCNIFVKETFLKKKKL